MRKSANIISSCLVIALLAIATGTGYAQNLKVRAISQLSTQKREGKLDLVSRTAAATPIFNHTVEPGTVHFPAIVCRYASRFYQSGFIHSNKKFRDAFLLIYPFEAFW